MSDELIFLDTETTGNELTKDRLVQLCYQSSLGTRVGLFKPPLPISVKAMSITHITNKIVADKETFAHSAMKQELEGLLKEGILVAHTATFDVAMLRAEGVEVPRFICTLRVARYLDPENKIPEHNLQFLRYFLELEVEGTAHDALGDVNVLKALFERLHKKLSIEEMLEISARPTLFKYFNFGKHKGQSLDEVVEIDRPYLEWLHKQKVATPESEEDWLYTLEYYLRK